MTTNLFELKKNIISTPIGNLVAIADAHSLCFLDFADKKNIEQRIERLLQKTNAQISDGITSPIESIKNELHLYFSRKLHTFQTPLSLNGTTFQQLAWRALQNIPYGTQTSYLEQAKSINKPLAFRAVAQANGANPIVIVIPCHRVISSNKEFGGYSGGVERKKWLLAHENSDILTL